MCDANYLVGRRLMPLVLRPAISRSRKPLAKTLGSQNRGALEVETPFAGQRAQRRAAPACCSKRRMDRASAIGDTFAYFEAGISGLADERQVAFDPIC